MYGMSQSSVTLVFDDGTQMQVNTAEELRGVAPKRVVIKGAISPEFMEKSVVPLLLVDGVVLEMEM